MTTERIMEIVNKQEGTMIKMLRDLSKSVFNEIEYDELTKDEMLLLNGMIQSKLYILITCELLDYLELKVKKEG